MAQFAFSRLVCALSEAKGMMKTMSKSILIIAKHLNIGGAEKMLLRFLPIFFSLGYKVDIYLLYNTGILLESKLDRLLNSDQCTVSSFFSEKKDEYKKIMKENPISVYKKNIRKEYNIEIAFQESYATKIVSNSPNENSQKIAWIHTNFEEYHFSAHAYNDNFEELQTYQSFDKIVFCSHSAKQAFDRVLANNFQNKYVIYSPISTEMCKKYATQYVPSITGTYFLVLSRLSPQKGLDRLIEAARILKGRSIFFKIIIIGSGELESTLRTMILNYGLLAQVQLHPSMVNPFPYLENCQAYISSSYTESFGIAVQEALCMSVPVIACDTSGTQEVLKEGKFGEIIPPSEFALADALERYICDTSFANTLRNKAQKGSMYWNKFHKTTQKELEYLLLPDARIN